MKILYPFLAVLILALLAYVGAGVARLEVLFGIVLPYVAIFLFMGGFTYRVLRWAQSPVPFRITSTSGQQKSLPWIKSNPIESPPNNFWVVVRLAMEVLFFRSLFRNSKAEVRDGRIVFWGEWLLWAAGLAFHYSLLSIFIRHFRFFTEPVPGFIGLLTAIDGIFQWSVPTVYLSTGLVLIAGGYLFLRRITNPQVRYLSLPADYFALFLILGIALTGALMRHFYRVDLLAVKELAMSLVTFRPALPEGIGPIFYAHFFLVSVLLAYFPYSKLMHLGGVFLSPTRNLANNNRMHRHVNPWDYPVEVHTYAEWQEEFRDKLEIAGLPYDEEAARDHAVKKGHAAAVGVKHG